MTSSKTGAVRVVLMLCAAVLAFGVWGTGMAGAATKTTVKVTKVPDVGSVLADSSGKTLYTLTDANGAAVECTGPCLTAWPAYMVTATKAKAPKGVKSIAISDTNQVTWKGLPLYTFSGDDAAKVAKGNGLVSFGGTWSVVKVGKTASTPVTTTPKTSSGYSGY